MDRYNLTNRIRNESGQTATEMALVLPVFCLLLFGVIQFGILFNNFVTLTDGVRAGARKAAVSRQSGNPVGACQNAIRSSAADLDQSKLTTDCQSTWQPGADVVVTATFPYEINLLGLVFAKGNLKSTTTERVE